MCLAGEVHFRVDHRVNGLACIHLGQNCFSFEIILIKQLVYFNLRKDGPVRLEQCRIEPEVEKIQQDAQVFSKPLPCSYCFVHLRVRWSEYVTTEVHGFL